jgi:hypothetical protein
MQVAEHKNHSSSTAQSPFPELNMRSMRNSSLWILANHSLHCGKSAGLCPRRKDVPSDQSLSSPDRSPCGVVGNHDFESGKIQEVQSILAETGIHILDGESIEILGTGFAGVCGFGGGFDRQMLNPWGEPIIKAFVQEALDHSLRLEKAFQCKCRFLTWRFR